MLILTVPPVALSAWLADIETLWIGALVELLLLYLCIGHRSLRDHALQVAEDLERGDTEAARASVSMLVSRETAEMDDAQISAATIEAMTEMNSKGDIDQPSPSRSAS